MLRGSALATGCAPGLIVASDVAVQHNGPDVAVLTGSVAHGIILAEHDDTPSGSWVRCA